MNFLKNIHRRLLPDDPAIGWTPYLWLIYIVYFLFRYYFDVPGATEQAAIIVTLVIFLVLYFNGYWKRGWALLPNMIGLVVLGLIWAPSNVGASVFFIYAAAFAAWLGPAKRALAALLIITAVAFVTGWFLETPMAYWIPPAVLCLLVGLANMFSVERERQAAVLKLTQQEVRQMAEVAERERISRDLHDLLGHTLSIITLKAELASRLSATDPERAGAEMRDVEQVSRQALAQIREAVSGMNARGFSGELEQARLALKAAGIEDAITSDVPAMKPEIEATLAMVLREAVTNVARHSRATRCTICVQDDSSEVVLEVRNDGRNRAQNIQDGVGSGIGGMRSRLADIGGNLDIDIRNGEWILRASIPT